MELFSLRSIIDDILLIVRNNNISESEDLSRAQIAAWILAYRAAIIKAKRDAEDEDEEDDDDSSLTSLIETKGPLELEYEETKDNIPLFRKKTVNKIPKLFDNDPRNLFSVHDLIGNPIQNMSEERKFFHKWRKYTGWEFTYYYENGYIMVEGADIDHLSHIWIEGLFSGDDDIESIDEDEYEIPGWMIPDIKNNIMKNELSFMLQRISDDDNNSTLDGIKPQAQGVHPVNEK